MSASRTVRTLLRTLEERARQAAENVQDPFDDTSNAWIEPVLDVAAEIRRLARPWLWVGNHGQELVRVSQTILEVLERPAGGAGDAAGHLSLLPAGVHLVRAALRASEHCDGEPASILATTAGGLVLHFSNGDEAEWTPNATRILLEEFAAAQPAAAEETTTFLRWLSGLGEPLQRLSGPFARAFLDELRQSGLRTCNGFAVPWRLHDSNEALKEVVLKAELSLPVMLQSTRPAEFAMGTPVHLRAVRAGSPGASVGLTFGDAEFSGEGESLDYALANLVCKLVNANEVIWRLGHMFVRRRR